MTEYEKKYWDGIVKDANNGNKDIVICKGSVYYINREHTWCRGCYGTQYNIKFNDGRKEVTDDLWVVGEIPDEYKEKLQDNATELEIVTKQETNNLIKEFLGGN